MKSTISLLCILLYMSTASFCQDSTLFQVSERKLTDEKRREINHLKENKKALFEDEKYIVNATCSGEWGGTVKFKDKKTGTEYACKATCAVSVNKVGGKYIVTSYLAHLSGSSEIVEILNPLSMKVYVLPPFRNEGGKKVRYVGEVESDSDQGITVLMDSVGIHTLASFVYQDTLFSIVSDRQRTYVGKMEDKKMKVVQPICSERLWSYESDIVKTKDGHLIIPASGGYLDVWEDQITLLR